MIPPTGRLCGSSVAIDPLIDANVLVAARRELEGVVGFDAGGRPNSYGRAGSGNKSKNRDNERSKPRTTHEKPLTCDAGSLRAYVQRSLIKLAHYLVAGHFELRRTLRCSAASSAVSRRCPTNCKKPASLHEHCARPAAIAGFVGMPCAALVSVVCERTKLLAT